MITDLKNHTTTPRSGTSTLRYPGSRQNRQHSHFRQGKPANHFAHSRAHIPSTRKRHNPLPLPTNSNCDPPLHLRRPRLLRRPPRHRQRLLRLPPRNPTPPQPPTKLTTLKHNNSSLTPPHLPPTIPRLPHRHPRKPTHLLPLRLSLLTPSPSCLHRPRLPHSFPLAK